MKNKSVTPVLPLSVNLKHIPITPKSKRSTPVSPLNVNSNQTQIIPKSKRSQEELVGFALIIIIVSVIILSILFFVLRGDKKNEIESYEIDSFVQASLQYTTKCQDSFGNLSLRKLIVDKCAYEQECSNNVQSCAVLNSTMKEMLDSNFFVGDETPIKGYLYSIYSGENEIVSLGKGNETDSYKSSLQDFSKGSEKIKISLKIYY